MTVLGYVLQAGPCWGGGQGGMGPGWGMGGMGGMGGMNGGFWGLGGLWSLLWFVVVVGLLALGIYLLVTRTALFGERGDTALAALRERYARGEIDTEEYERRLQTLSEPSQ